jgi:hypothetical protein
MFFLCCCCSGRYTFGGNFVLPSKVRNKFVRKDTRCEAVKERMKEEKKTKLSSDKKSLNE